MSQTKKILAYLRNGDFAHPGEIEAILLTMQPIAQYPNQRLLDVGCGLGGTADYLQQQGYGKIVGIDIDSELIDYAKHHYPNVSFLNADILDIDKYLNQKFNVLYCFSSFFCFPYPQESLLQLSRMAQQNAQLIIFDYSRFSAHTFESPFHWSKTANRFNPIYLPELKEILSISGWTFKSHVDINLQFQQWYTKFLLQFNLKKKEMTELFDPGLLNAMCDGFHLLLEHIKEGKVGGIIVYAQKT